MRASLIPLDGSPPIEIDRDVTVIGRKDFCDVQLDDPSVSKVHLLIVQTDGALVFRDMGSTNGTKVNGQRVIRGVLMPNDKLNIAACKYQVQLMPDAQSTREVDETPVAPAVGSSPVVRVYKAEELAQQAAGPDSKDGRDRRGAKPDPGEEIDATTGSHSSPPAPPHALDDKPSGAAPEFVD